MLVLTANPLLDHVADIDLVPGQQNRVSHFQMVAGGKGINVGRVLVAHGHHVIACGFAGGATGAQFTRLVRAEGQEARFTTTAAPLRMGFLARNCGHAGVTGCLENGFAVGEGEIQACLATCCEALTHCDLCLICGSTPDPSCDDLYAQLRMHCAQVGVPCWIDSYGRAMARALACDPAPDLVKPNREELAKGGDFLRARSCHISHGAQVLEIHHLGQRWSVKPPPVQSVNPVASGDCYLAALAHGMVSGWPLAQQLAYAAAAGALNASMLAMAQLDPQAIAALAPQAIVTNTPGHG